MEALVRSPAVPARRSFATAGSLPALPARQSFATAGNLAEGPNPPKGRA